MGKLKSILQEKKECFRCRTAEGLHEHHIFGGGRRELSEKYGLKVYLCGKHHNLSNEGVHFNPAFDRALKKLAQRVFEHVYGHDMFMKIFGKNYLGDE